MIPAFVYRAIRSDSPTGFFRNPNNPNQRLQDGDRLELLCRECEQRFGNAEREFERRIFAEFHKADRDRFSYGPWLHYFMTSLAWRTLILDLPGLDKDTANPRSAIQDLTNAAETMRWYLLGASNLGPMLRNHACVFVKTDTASAELHPVGANVQIRRSVFGYTMVDRRFSYSVVLHNLAGFMCFLIVKGNPRDTWYQTKVSPGGGVIEQPQRVHSSFVGDLLGTVLESGQKLQKTLSEKQREKVRQAVQQNPAAPGLRFREMDRRLIVSE